MQIFEEIEAMNEQQSAHILDAKKIAQILPHRYPILLVDRIIHLDLDKDVIIGQKNVTMNEHFFAGHFPGVPIMPGVLILEALAQTGGILVHQKLQTDKIAVLLTVNNAKFRKPVTPGDVLHLHILGQHISFKGGKVAAKAMVNNTIVVEADIGFALVDREQL
jgi:3-hydroxyacyl-[acyl-carrier-protein] dehydratase